MQCVCVCVHTLVLGTVDLTVCVCARACVRARVRAAWAQWITRRPLCTELCGAGIPVGGGWGQADASWTLSSVSARSVDSTLPGVGGLLEAPSRSSPGPVAVSLCGLVCSL